MQAVLDRLHSILDEPQSTNHQKINAVLQLGLDVFDMDVAIVSQIDMETEHYAVMYSQATGGRIEPGTVFELGLTYCSMTIKMPLVFAIANAEVSEHRRHPCYTKFKLASYIGYILLVDDQLYGTINFSSPLGRDQIEDDARRLIQEMGGAVGDLLMA